MEIAFETSKMQKICNSQKKLRGKYGDRMSKLIQSRLADLAAVDNLDQMRPLPGRCHELTENLEGMLAIDLVHPQRLVFKPTANPRPEKEDGGLDWKRVTKVTIVDIDDYH